MLHMVAGGQRWVPTLVASSAGLKRVQRGVPRRHLLRWREAAGAWRASTGWGGAEIGRARIGNGTYRSTWRPIELAQRALLAAPQPLVSSWVRLHTEGGGGSQLLLPAGVLCELMCWHARLGGSVVRRDAQHGVYFGSLGHGERYRYPPKLSTQRALQLVHLHSIGVRDKAHRRVVGQRLENASHGRYSVSCVARVCKGGAGASNGVRGRVGLRGVGDGVRGEGEICRLLAGGGGATDSQLVQLVTWEGAVEHEKHRAI